VRVIGKIAHVVKDKLASRYYPENEMSQIRSRKAGFLGR